MENPIKMDDLGVRLFLETPICFRSFLVGGFNPFEKSARQKWESFPPICGVKIQKIYETPPSLHRVDFFPWIFR